jgi:fimbrial chaperone protein
LLYPIQAKAGSFKVVPIKLFLDARTKTAVLRVSNNGEEKATIQLDVMMWSQDNTGKDIYEKTKDILVFPKILTIDKSEERIVRIGYQGQQIVTREKAYRLYLRELPVSKPGKTTFKFALTLVVPIFISSPKALEKWSLVGGKLAEGRTIVTVENSGNTHLIVKKIKATGLNSSNEDVFSKEIRGWYVLAGVNKTYALDILKEECIKAQTIKIEVEVDKTIKDLKLDVDKTMCRGKQKN